MRNLNNKASVKSIAFIDTLVENYQSLIAGVKPGTEVVVLDGNRDAIDQITQILALRTNIDSIHIVSHGDPGSLQLGDVRLSLDEIECDRNSLQQWFSQRTYSLGKNRPNILLYGCSVAAGQTGKAFVKRLSELTGARVAASQNLTGSVAKGGDWELEVSTGSIETPLVFEPEVLAGYEYVLSTFGAATNFPITYSLRKVATEDFNKDGNLDLAFASTGVNRNVSVALGDGTGKFGAATNLNTSPPTNLGTWSVAVGDFNGDGNYDLVTANNFTNNVSLLLGNGNGTFGTATYFGVGSSPYGVAVGDFNADGNFDVATANQSSNNVSILPGNGNGTFGTATNLSVGSSPYFVLVGDFNKDGKSDFATANSGSNSVSILLQNANGTFGTATNFTVGNSPNYIALGDFNGDNNPDLATSNESSNNVSILLGNGAGNFSAATNFNVATQPLAIAAGDFNADGKVDLATANNGSGNVSVLFGSGNGSFGTATNFIVGTSPQGIVVGDFNKDGLSDVATANFGGQNTSILLNTSPAVNFGAATYSGTEGTADTVVNIPVTISGTPDAAFTVPIVIDPSSTATPNSDYTISPTSITFPAGATGAALTQNVAVTIKPDNLPENAETAILNLGTIIGGIAGTTKQTTLTIAANGSVSYAIAAGTASIPEGNSGTKPLTFTATRSGNTGGASSVNYAITGTATNVSDYNNIGGTSGATAATGTINFAAGETSKTITLDVLGDTLVEPDETIAVTLSNPAGPGSTPTITAATATTTITNDDKAGFTINPTALTTSEVGGKAEFTVKLNSQPAADVTIGLSSDNLAEGTVSTNSLTFTPANYSLPQTITVSGIDDLVADGPIPYKIVTAAAVSTDANYNNLAPDDVTVTNSDNDIAGITVNPTAGLTTGEDGTKANFTVVLNTQPTADVTIGLNSDNVAEGTVSTNSLTFTPANWNTPQPVTVTGVEDSIVDGDIDYKIVTAAAVSTDANYSNREVADVSITNKDNDTAGVSITPTQTTATEGGATGSYALKLTSQPIVPVTINFNAGSQINAIEPVTFDSTNWNVAKTVTLTATNDSKAEGTHSGTIAHTVTSTDTKYSDTTIPDVNVAITDNDTAGVSITPTSTTAAEGGANGSYTVKLNSQPIAPVTINFNAGSQINAIAPVTFDSTNWNVAKTVTVTATDDSKAEGTHSGTIAHTVTSTDTKYSGTTIPDVNVAITDNDTAGVSITPTSTTAAEGGANGSYTLKLNSQPIAPVTITLTTGEQIQAIAPITFTTDNWNVAQPVTVKAVDDTVVEGAHSANITHSVSSTDAKYNLIVVPGVTVAIADNDSTPTPTPTPTPPPPPPPTPTPTPPPPPTPTPTPTPIPPETPTVIPTEVSTAIPAEIPAETPTTTEIPTEDCRCNSLSLPNLNQPNPVEKVVVNSAIDLLLTGSASNETFDGSSSEDYFQAKEGNDNLFGGEGNDFLNGNEGNDFISGGTEDDLLFGGKNQDIILGNEGRDTLFGNRGEDSLNGREDSDFIYGNEDSDFLDGGKGNDFLLGGKDRDLILGSEGNDTLLGNLGDDTACAGGGNDYLRGDENNDLLDGCEGNDTIWGGEDNDTIFGGAGDDFLSGDLGDDFLIGGSGSDRFLLSTNFGIDTIDDFEVGQDLLVLGNGLTFSQLAIAEDSGSTLIRFAQTGEILATISGVSASNISAVNFGLL